jgi:hypothetical protein
VILTHPKGCGYDGHSKRLLAGCDSGFGLEDVEVEDGFDAGEGFAQRRAQHPSEWKFLGGVRNGVDAVVATEEQCAKIVKAFGDDGEVFAFEDVARTHDGIECSQAVIIQDHGRLGDAALQQCALQFHRFIVPLVATEDEPPDLAGMIQHRRGVDATHEMLVDAALLDQLARRQHQAVGVERHRIDLIKHARSGGRDDPDVAGNDGGEAARQEGERGFLEWITALGHRRHAIGAWPVRQA